MATLLILDPDGPRRSRLATAAEAAGHRPLNAGTLAEAVRVAAIYQPEAVLVAAAPPDGDLEAVTAALAQADKRKTDRCVLVLGRKDRSVDATIEQVREALNGAHRFSAEEAASG